ncbi:uncharacterized protein FFM5_10367 [Fusarium fujikuroi]|nr:uncharacterized protein FFC1_02068 [Fusarium fujikuroi]SCO12675.1 uncharacterized protein FFM5_10367 [Fusarium fujikuroi]SCV53932.1 uncharacterized protein FFFS_11011 [Fusarium fujikuroi]
MTASQADPDPHSPTTNGLFTIPQLFRIQTTLEPIGTRFSVPHQFAALSRVRYRPRLWVNRASFPRNEVTAARREHLELVSVPLQEVKAALTRRAARMNQWTFFNKKIEAFKAQSNDGSTPSTPVKKATPGRKRAPKAKKGGSDEQSAAQVMENQMYQAQPVLTGNFMPMDDVFRPLARGIGETLEHHPFSGLALPGRAPNPTPDTTERAPKGQVVVASQQVPEDQLVVAAQQHPWLPSQLLAALPIWTYLSILIYSSMSLCRYTQAHLTMGMQAQGHPARSGVTAYWGCLCRWSDEEEANET